VKVTLVQGGELTGRVTAADEDGTDLLIDGAAEPRRLAYADVAKAKVQVEFNRAGAEDELAGLEDSEDAESTGVDGDAADQDGVDWDGAEPGAESGGGAGTDES
jgi:ribosome maturation factor RimP